MEVTWANNVKWTKLLNNPLAHACAITCAPVAPHGLHEAQSLNVFITSSSFKLMSF